MSEVIKRYLLNSGDDTLHECATGNLVFVQDLLSGHVLEHDGVRYRLIRADPLPAQDISNDPPPLF